MKQQDFSFYPKKNILKFLGNNKPKILEKRHSYTLGARSAIYLFLKSNPTNKYVLVPSYNCGKEVEAIINSGHKILPYKIRKDRAIDISFLNNAISKNEVGAVIITHFFGVRDPRLEEIVTTCRENKILVIEDCAHCYPGEEQKIIGDAAVFSIRKFYPLKNLGLLVVNNNHLKLRHHWKGPISDRTNPNFGPLKNYYGSNINILDVLRFRFADHDTIKKLRLKNYYSLASRFKEKQIKSINLFAYILPDNQQYQIRNNEHVINFWDRFHPDIDWENFQESADLKNNTRVLPLNQDFSYGRTTKH